MGKPVFWTPCLTHKAIRWWDTRARVLQMCQYIGASRDAHAWFQFPIATPVIHNGVRVRLVKVFVLFRSDPDVVLTEVHVWDGPRRIDAFAPESVVSGVHDGSRGLADLVPNVTAWTVNQRPEVFCGLSVAARIHFKAQGAISFTSAGADFDF